MAQTAEIYLLTALEAVKSEIKVLARFISSWLVGGHLLFASSCDFSCVCVLMSSYNMPVRLD